MAFKFGLEQAVMLFFFIFILFFTSIVVSDPSFKKIKLPAGVMGPESLAFELNGGVFYTGVGDGRVLKYVPNVGFLDHAYTTPNRSKAVCDGTTNFALGSQCGRPLGLALNYVTNELYIADAYYGLLVAGTSGGLATPLVTAADGQQLRLCNGVDVDQLTGNVYFTDFSSVYDLRHAKKAVLTGDSTGRLLKYDPRTKQVTLLLKDLSGPAGVAVSKDSSFVLVSELVANRTQKYWLIGPRSNTTDVINFQGRPNNIKSTALGEFWEAAMVQKVGEESMVPIGQRINGFGNVLQTISFEAQYKTNRISEVQEFAGALYIGSMYAKYIGVYMP